MIVKTKDGKEYYLIQFVGLDNMLVAVCRTKDYKLVQIKPNDIIEIGR